MCFYPLRFRGDGLLGYRELQEVSGYCTEKVVPSFYNSTWMVLVWLLSVSIFSLQKKGFDCFESLTLPLHASLGSCMVFFNLCK